MSILAVDFDGTLVEHVWPSRAFIPKQDIINRVKFYQEVGHQLILWTCRDKEFLAEAVEFCRGQGLIFDAVNENIPNPGYPFPTSAKVYADFYLDDKALNVKDFL